MVDGHQSGSNTPAPPVLVGLLAAMWLVGVGVARAETGLANAGDTEWRRVRALLAGGIDATFAQAVLDGAWARDVQNRIAALEGLGPDALVGEGRRALDDAGLSGAARERLLHAVARQLGRRGEPSSLPLLDELVRRPAALTVQVPGCKGRVIVPVFPYRAAANHAASRVRIRSLLAELEALAPADRIAWILAACEQFPRTERFLAAAEDVRRLAPGTLLDLRARLEAAAKPWPRPAAELLVECCLRARSLPSLESFWNLPAPAAQRLVLEFAASGTRQERLASAALARRHTATASMAAFLCGGEGAPTVRRFLATDGASAAAVLARDETPDMTARLVAVLVDPDAADEIRRYAAVGLVQQGTAGARAAVLEALAARRVPPELETKLRGWAQR